MKKILPLTYDPKIQAVLEGRCRQTIRLGSRFAVGDEIMFPRVGGPAVFTVNGRSGRPYLPSTW